MSDGKTNAQNKQKNFKYWERTTFLATLKGFIAKILVAIFLNFERFSTGLICRK